MSDREVIADRFEIEALCGEFTDAVMMRDYDRFASLFIEDGAWRIPYINTEFVSREEIRAGIEWLQGLWDYFVQTLHPGTIQLEGDTAVGRAYVSELGHLRDGSSQKKVLRGVTTHKNWCPSALLPAHQVAVASNTRRTPPMLQQSCPPRP